VLSIPCAFCNGSWTEDGAVCVAIALRCLLQFVLQLYLHGILFVEFRKRKVLRFVLQYVTQHGAVLSACHALYCSV